MMTDRQIAGTYVAERRMESFCARARQSDVFPVPGLMSRS